MTGYNPYIPFEPVDFSDPQPRRNGEELSASEGSVAAYARGYEEGEQAFAANMAARTGAALEAIAEALESIRAGLQSQRRQLRAEAVQLSFAFARKLAGRLVERDPAGLVLEAFASLAFDLAERADVSIRLSPQALEGVREALSGDAARVAPLPRLIPDDALAPGNCQIDWSEGGLIRDLAKIEAKLDALIARSFASTPTQEITP